MKHTPILIAGIALALFGAACTKQPSQQTQQTNNQTEQTSLANSSDTNRNDTPGTGVSWSFNGTAWQSSGTPPACPSPLTIQTPFDLTSATAILYPGQTRGGNYKPHGGAIYRSALDNEKVVVAPMDATVYNGVRYIEAGEVQYLFTFINDCGIAYRFDHLLTLSPAMQAIADTLPAATASSATTFIQGKTVKAGDTIATHIGFQDNLNVSVDFGLYDLRTKNGTTKGGAELGEHALCWLNNLPAADMTKAKALPGGDQAAGKTSEYCK